MIGVCFIFLPSFLYHPPMRMSLTRNVESLVFHVEKAKQTLEFLCNFAMDNEKSKGWERKLRALVKRPRVSAVRMWLISSVLNGFSVHGHLPRPWTKCLRLEKLNTAVCETKESSFSKSNEIFNAAIWLILGFRLVNHACFLWYKHRVSMFCSLYVIHTLSGRSGEEMGAGGLALTIHTTVFSWWTQRLSVTAGLFWLTPPRC